MPWCLPPSPLFRPDALHDLLVQIEQMSNIKDAEAKESRIISRTKPPHNEKGK